MRCVTGQTNNKEVNIMSMKWVLFWLVMLFVVNIINRFRFKGHKKNSRREYQKYLSSNHWHNKRREVLDYYGKQCVLCGCKDENQLIIHHRRYDNLGHEPMEDLVPLCRSCHSRYHNQAIKDNKYKE